MLDAGHMAWTFIGEYRESMRRTIVNAVIVTGDGHTILENHSLVMEDGMITDLVSQPYLPYDPAGDIVNAEGALVIPGLINHHSHGAVLGPFNVFGEFMRLADHERSGKHGEKASDPFADHHHPSANPPETCQIH